MQAMDRNKHTHNRRSLSVWKRAVLFVIAGVVLFLSIRIEPLGSQDQQDTVFDVAAYVDAFFADSLVERIDAAPEVCTLIDELSLATEDEWAVMGNQVAIGSKYCFLTRGNGIVARVDTDAVVLRLAGSDGPRNVRVATEYVFGNEVRDASGMIRLEDFDDLTVFNQLSEVINERIRTQVLPTFVNSVEVRDSVFVAGACCMNTRLRDMEDIELIPIELNIYR